MTTDISDAGLAVAVLVRIGSTRYVLGAEAVAEVVPPPVVTRVPGLPAWVSGVANWRGRVLAVIDLHVLLEDDAVPGDVFVAPERRVTGRSPSSGRLVVISQDGISVGLAVDDVPGVLDGTLPDVEPTPPTLPMAARSILAGQVVLDGEPLGVLDIAAVLGLRRQIDRSRTS